MRDTMFGEWGPFIIVGGSAVLAVYMLVNLLFGGWGVCDVAFFVGGGAICSVISCGVASGLKRVKRQWAWRGVY